jgi:hypothetical protein
MLLGRWKPLDLTVPIFVTFGATNTTSSQPSLLLILPLADNSLRNRVSEAEGDEVGRAVLPPVRQIAAIDSDGGAFVERDEARAGLRHRRKTEFIPFIACVLVVTAIIPNWTKNGINSVLQSGQQIADFLVDLLRAGDGLGDFVPQQLAVSAAEAVDGRFDGALGHFQLGGDLGVAA